MYELITMKMPLCNPRHHRMEATPLQCSRKVICNLGCYTFKK